MTNGHPAGPRMVLVCIAAAVTVAAGSCTPYPPPRPAPPAPPGGETPRAETPREEAQRPGRTRDGNVRVGLVENASTIEIVAGSKRRSFARGGIPAGEPYEVPGIDRDEGFEYAGRRYRGNAVIQAREGGGLTLVNVVSLEDYLRGVVPLEIGTRSEADLEAVKAQAVAARTYALFSLGQYGDRGFDLVATVMDQVYQGLSAETALGDRAVRETADEVMTAREGLVRAFYHSTCGGQTARIEEVWTRPPASYLCGVNDRARGDSEDDAYCRSSPHFRWKETWSAKELAPILAENLSAETGRTIKVTPGAIEDIRVEAKGGSGRVRDVAIRVGGETYHVFGDRIRWVLRPAKPSRPILRSARIDIDVRRTGGHVVELTVHGSGNGHGVGMCQVGALAMARLGHAYDDILEHYYPGIRIVPASSLSHSGCPPAVPLLPSGGSQFPRPVTHVAEITTCNTTLPSFPETGSARR